MTRTVLYPTVVALLMTLSLVPAMADDEQKIPTITVTGQGEVSTRPDTATVVAGVVTEDKSAAEALRQNSQAMQDLFRLLRNRGIAEKDMQTSNFSVSPRYRHDERGQRTQEIVGYEVRNDVRVKVRKLEILGKLLDELVSEGANRLYGISFSVDDPTALLDEARRQSMADARRKAELYAQQADLTLGKVRAISEHSVHRPQPYRLAMAEQVRTAAVPVATGELEFRVNVNVVYTAE